MHAIEIKRLIRVFLVYGIGGILQKFMGLLLLPLFTRVLSPDDYGVLALIGFVAVALNSFFSLGTGNSMGLLYFKEENPERRLVVVWSTAALMLINGALLAGGLCLAAAPISMLVFETESYANLLRLTFISLLFASVMDPFLAYLRMEEKAKQYVVLTLMSACLAIALNAWFVLGLRWGIVGAAIAGVTTTALSLAAVGWVVARHLPFCVDLKLLKPLVRIGFPSIFGLFAFLLIDYADRQMLQRMAGLQSLGVYSVGYNFGMAMMIFVGAFSTAWPPFFMSFINRREEASILFGKILRYYIGIFGLLTVIFFAAAKPLVVFLAGERFQEAYVIIGMVASAYMLKGCYLILLPSLYFENKLAMQSAIEWLAALVNVALNFLWIPAFGIVGAAAATFVGYLVLPIAAWAVGQRYMPVKYCWSSITAIAALLFGSGYFLWWFSLQGSPASIVSVSSAIVSLLAILMYRFGLDAEERNAIVNDVKNLMAKYSA
ncbi:MAG: hypothetical protein CVU32_01070 [Betaproteobacteria bacterium HGW-Betaproteobacteria-5]|jgi:O-antigen/teichoic acid export membrane protein|nr:MAG: hypothetical protein CVU32_01070 [Betaproteobacteria bacterium HGW-Betaproteobacteria-5]PKO30662.1 MAG: hypothetical protein CVU34_19235 [Betaproteobacteria bacterium HGW-Betaproteobacteria-7]